VPGDSAASGVPKRLRRDYGVSVPHHVRTGEPFDPETMLWSDRDFTDEELTRQGTTREDYWRQQHKSDREDALALNAVNAYPVRGGQERLPTPPLVRPR